MNEYQNLAVKFKGNISCKSKCSYTKRPFVDRNPQQIYIALQMNAYLSQRPIYLAFQMIPTLSGHIPTIKRNIPYAQLQMSGPNCLRISSSGPDCSCCSSSTIIR